jgi:hypothetical protein
MEPACIRHTDLPGASRLCLDFTYHFDRVAKFYRHDPHDAASLLAAAREVNYPDDRRAAMARALEAQNGPSDSLSVSPSRELSQSSPGSRWACFPAAYTIYKALTAAKLAAKLTAQGTPAVPVFWLATEDHDFPEVNHVWSFDAPHQPSSLKSLRQARRTAGKDRSAES